MKTLITIIIVVLLATGGYYGFTIYKEKIGFGKDGDIIPIFQKDVKAISNAEMEELATIFFKTASGGDIDGAYSMATEGFKYNVPRTEWPSITTKHFGKKKFKALRSIGFSYSKTAFRVEELGARIERWVYEYSGIITYNDNSERKAQVFLVKDEEQWKVDGFAIVKNDIPPGSPDNSDRNIKAVSNTEVEQVVAAFLKTFSSADIEGVYKMAIEEYETAVPRNEMPRFISQAFGGKKLKGLKNKGFSYSKRYWETDKPDARIERWAYIYSGIITFTDEREKELDIVLSKEGGQWKVLHFEIDIEEAA